MSKEFLNPRQKEFLDRERQLLAELQACFDTFEKTKAYSNELRKINSDLDELFLLVVVGEFSAGKSALINALLHRSPGSPVLKEGITRTTEKVTFVHFGEKEREDEVTNMAKFYPSDFLHNICIVDTPGINSTEEHKKITYGFIKQSDIVLYVMASYHASSEKDREMLSYINSLGLYVIIVINMIDLVETTEDLLKVEKQVKEDCENFLGFVPKIYPLSARKAQEVYEASDREEIIEKLSESRIEPLERELRERLGNAARIGTKLRKRLDKMRNVQINVRKEVEEYNRSIDNDENIVNEIRRLASSHLIKMKREIPQRISLVSTILFGMKERSNKFFEENSFRNFLDPTWIKDEYEKNVIRDSEQQINNAILASIDWLVDEQSLFFRDVKNEIDKLRLMSNLPINSNDDENTQEIISKIKEILKTYDFQGEVARIYQSINTTIAKLVGGVITTTGSIGSIVAAVIASNPIFAGGGLIIGSVAAIFTINATRRNRKNFKKHFDYQIDKELKVINEVLTQGLVNEVNRFVDIISNFMTTYTEEINKIENTIDKILSQIALNETRITEMYIEVEDLR